MHSTALDRPIEGGTDGGNGWGGGRAAAPLGTHAKSAATKQTAISPAEARAERFWLQAVARRCLPDELRLAACLSWPVARNVGVSVWNTPALQRAHFAGLQTCGSVWQCAPCNVRIAEGRRRELSQAFDIWSASGGVFWFATFTRSHGRRDCLADVVEEFSRAQRSMVSSRDYKRWAARVGLVGTVAALEVTMCGPHGDHPHRHSGMLLRPPAGVDVAGARAELLAAWSAAGRRAGFTMTDRGLDLDVSLGAFGDYLVKVGHAPAPGRRPWGVEDELTKSISKRSRSGAGVSAFDLLRWAGETGELEQVLKMREFAGVFKGKRQLVWSPGLRRVLHELDPSFGVKERSDGDLAAERLARGDVLLAALSEGEWRAVRRLDRRSALLDVADGGDGEAVAAFVAGVVAEYEQGGGNGRAV
jgi:hypothetical protein